MTMGMNTPRWFHRWSPGARVSTLLPSVLLTMLLIASPARSASSSASNTSSSTASPTSSASIAAPRTKPARTTHAAPAVGTTGTPGTAQATRTKPPVKAGSPAVNGKTPGSREAAPVARPAAARGDAKRVCYAPGAACELAANRGSQPRTQDRERTHGRSGVSPGQQRRLLGMASYYGAGFANRPTANGERFDPRAMTAAHRTLPFGTRVRVTNLENGRQVVVRINDRGPYRKDRVLDLSRAAAHKLGFLDDGVAHVRIEVLKGRKSRKNRDHLTDDMQASRDGVTRTRSKSRA